MRQKLIAIRQDEDVMQDFFYHRFRVILGFCCSCIPVARNKS